MNFAFSEEQEEFRATLRRFFEEKAPSAEVRRMMESPEGYDRGLWKQLSEELGLPGVHIPEAYGGQGFGFLELGIVLEEMGRVLLPGPYFATVALAANAILAAGSEEQKRSLLPAIATGETLATLALTEASGRWDAAGVEVVAAPDTGGFRITGRNSHVVDGASADLLVVAARTPEGALALFSVSGDDPDVKATPFESLDPLRRHAHLDFAGARAELLGRVEQGEAALRLTLELGAIALAAEMVGAAQRCLEMAVEYAKVRMQFARPIGSFQAVKHKAAEVLLEVESAKSAAYWSWWAADQGDDAQRAEAAHLAKSVCGDALQRAAAENVQIHGGVAFTWEHDAQLYYKRAKSADVLLGDAVHHRARLAELLGF